MAISGLCAALLTPVAWLLVRLSGLLSPLARIFDLQLWPLHLVAGLFGCLVGWVLLSLLHQVSGGTAGRVMIVAGGFAGATVSSVLFFPLVALF